MVFRRCPNLPRGLPRSTIGAEGLNFRVRNGTGGFRFAMAAATLLSYQPKWLPAAAREPHSERDASKNLGKSASPRPVSTGQLSPLRSLHFRPITPVVWLGALPTRGGG